MSSFRADCSRCCGLCCVVPGQLAQQGFPIDKPAETPCRHLDDRSRCSIHAMREMHGYAACQGFDCYGVGQWITQTLFGGAAWTGGAGQAAQMFAVYRRWAPRFAAAALLEAALPYVRAEMREAVVGRMKVLTSSTAVDDLPTDAVRLRRETLAMIRAALSPRRTFSGNT